MRAWGIKRVGAHAVEAPALARRVEDTQQRRLGDVAALEVQRLEGRIASDDVALVAPDMFSNNGMCDFMLLEFSQEARQ